MASPDRPAPAQRPHQHAVSEERELTAVVRFKIAPGSHRQVPVRELLDEVPISGVHHNALTAILATEAGKRRLKLEIIPTAETDPVGRSDERVNSYDVLVLKLRSRLDFPFESFELLRIRRQAVVHDLDGFDPVEFQVASFVNDAHSASPKFAKYFVSWNCDGLWAK
jgi:hypothetical protein